MKSIVIHAAKDLRIEDQPTTDPKQGEVQIDIAAGGICGSDLPYYQHGGIGDAIRLKEPMVLGHEVSGHITKIGAGVTNLKVGQLITVSPSRPCGSCDYCQKGQQNHCLNMRFYGSAMPYPHIQGAFPQTLNANASQCAVAEGLTAAEAAMAEPLAVCLHATNIAGSLLGKSVLVTGCGPIGVLSIMCARRAGADLIVADTWISMHDAQSAKERRHNMLRPYQVNAELMSHAKPDALFMHCLPAHREEEATSAVMDGPNSVIFDEAENRLHAQKAIMRWCLEK